MIISKMESRRDCQGLLYMSLISSLDWELIFGTVVAQGNVWGNSPDWRKTFVVGIGWLYQRMEIVVMAGPIRACRLVWRGMP